MGKLIILGGILLVASSVIGGGINFSVVDIGRGESSSNSNSNVNRDEKSKEIEKKPNIVKDYICLRDGELCHPNFVNNRGLYVSCSNGVAWELQCPKCSYHPLNCPTKSLWFDGEKCEWASPKLASQPCIDRFPAYEIHNATEKEISQHPASEQESLLQSLQSPSMINGNSVKEQPMPDKGKWPNNPMSVQPPPMYFKSPKSGEFDSEAIQEIDSHQQEQTMKSVSEDSSEIDDRDEEIEKLKNKILKRQYSEAESPSEPDFPAYLSADDGAIGSKIVRLSEPVYALVNSPDGSGKQVLMRVYQPFVFEDSGRSLLPNFNSYNSYSNKY